jgi:hypothetical protein
MSAHPQVAVTGAKHSGLRFWMQRVMKEWMRVQRSVEGSVAVISSALGWGKTKEIAGNHIRW